MPTIGDLLAHLDQQYRHHPDRSVVLRIEDAGDDDPIVLEEELAELEAT